MKEKVAAGLRNMTFQPAGLLVCGSAEGLPTEIAGIPIYDSSFIDNNYSDNDIPFIPIWRDTICDNMWHQRRLFEQGYLGEI